MGKAELETGNPEEALKYLKKLNNHKTVKNVSNGYSLHQARLLLEVLYRRGNLNIIEYQKNIRICLLRTQS